MTKQPVVVRLKTGLHARPAALFVQEANKFSSEVFVEKDDKKVNAKSIMGIMSLAISSGTEVTISEDGSDAEQAVTALVNRVTKYDVDNQYAQARTTGRPKGAFLVWARDSGITKSRP